MSHLYFGLAGALGALTGALILVGVATTVTELPSSTLLGRICPLIARVETAITRMMAVKCRQLCIVLRAAFVRRRKDRVLQENVMIKKRGSCYFMSLAQRN